MSIGYNIRSHTDAHIYVEDAVRKSVTRATGREVRELVTLNDDVLRTYVVVWEVGLGFKRHPNHPALKDFLRELEA